MQFFSVFPVLVSASLVFDFPIVAKEVGSEFSQDKQGFSELMQLKQAECKHFSSSVKSCLLHNEQVDFGNSFKNFILDEQNLQGWGVVNDVCRWVLQTP